jgi:streptogramin lyase
MTERLRLAGAALLIALAATPAAAEPTPPGPAAHEVLRRPFAELKPTAKLRVGATADWVVVDGDAVWVGSTHPNAVHRIDARTAHRVATVELPGEPCAGLALGFGSLWVPLCASPNALARVDLASNRLTAVLHPGPAAAEGGITTGGDSVWLVTAAGTLSRIDPSSNAARQSIQLPAGSFNARYYEGIVWVTRAGGAEVTAVDAASGATLASITTGPGPRFLSAGDGSVWTLNQGDGSLTRIDVATRQVSARLALGTPGHGGDIGVGSGFVFTTMAGTPLTATRAATASVERQWLGRGGDSLAVAPDAVWLTDYHRGTIARYPLDRLLGR